MSGHEHIPPVQTLESRIPVNLPIGRNALIGEYIIPALQHIEEEIQLISHINHAIANIIIIVIIVLRLTYHITPLHIPIGIEGNYGNIIGIIAG